MKLETAKKYTDNQKNNQRKTNVFVIITVIVMMPCSNVG